MPVIIPEPIKVYSQFFHPLLMWTLLGLSIYALYLGIQVKKTRTADKEVRQELIKKNFNARHHLLGSGILALMVLGSIGGMTVTYINNGKLFVAPHLIAGLGMTGLIALAASLVPLMQKGKKWARSLHVALNLVLLCLFGWQAITGMDIVQRIISKM